MTVLLSLAFGTLISEDLTCISAGLLIRRGAVDPVAGVLACAAGIWIGDVALWAVGRVFGQAALRWPWIARHAAGRGVEHFRCSLRNHAGSAIVGSRFLPGARLPFYVIAGVLRMPCGLFALWAAVAALLWTPVLVIAAVTVGGLGG